MRISIAMATYNGEKYLQAQLDSFMVQSKQPDELVICDDGSKDNTIEIARRFKRSARFPVKLYINEENLGFAKNFEKAIALCSGDIIFLSDQDDVWCDHKIESLVKPLVENTDIGFVYSDAIVTNSNLQPINIGLFDVHEEILKAKCRSPSSIMRSLYVNGCTMAFRSELTNYVLPVGSNWGHDHWIIFIANAITEIDFVREPLMYYRRHDANTGGQIFLEPWYVSLMKKAINKSSVEDYEGDMRHWENMLLRLHEIKKKRSIAWIDYTKLDIFAKECEQRMKLAQKRRILKGKSRYGRLPDVLYILFTGHYYKYLNGMKSLAKDLLIL